MATINMYQGLPDFVQPPETNHNAQKHVICENCAPLFAWNEEKLVDKEPATDHIALESTTPDQCARSLGSTIQNPDPYEDKLEPIAVVGMAFRGPQEATSPSALWEILETKRSAMSKIPSSRFNKDAFCDVENPRLGLLNVDGGHFLTEDLAAFDAPFFAISAAEANLMDPQQRWLLETTYEALENAGIPLQKTSGSKTSVHIGTFTQDFSVLVHKDPQMHATYRATGIGMSILANKLSWYYDWTGPSLALDTACSSSLTTVHLACQSLRSGEADMGIAGGCNLIITPDTTTALTDMGFLSPDNICRTFDEKANGYSRGEGFGLVVLKRLKDAIRDQDTIRAVIRATGINQDAKTPSITQPSSAAQESLIKDTYEVGGLSMAPTRFFEAHGTGTPVGDPLEARAIYGAFKDQLTDHPLYVGAVKTNIGHLEGASGVTGLIKSIFVLEKGVIPPNMWLNKVNPKIPAEKWNLEFPKSCVPWPTSGLRRASVNSFGYGGANAHCVIDDAYHYLETRELVGNHNTCVSVPQQYESDTTTEESRQSYEREDDVENHDSNALLVWSAPDESGLKRLTEIYKTFLQTKPDRSQVYNHQLAFTLSERRTHFTWKSFSITQSSTQIQKSLTGDVSTPIRSIKDPRLCWVFSGQGAQSAQMGHGLENHPVFAKALDHADEYYHRLGSSWSLKAELEKPKETCQIDSAELSQPICTALQIALVDLLNEWGVSPHVVIGHSSGEIAAAFAAGAISRDSALKIAYFRGIVAAGSYQTRNVKQGMMAAQMSKDIANKYLARLSSDSCFMTVACINSPSSVTISGDAIGLDMLKAELDRDGIFCRKLKVEVAYHSKFMNDAARLYHLLIGKIEKGESSSHPIVMVSSVSGQKVARSELCNPEYWVQNLLQPVNFSDAVGLLCAVAATSSRKLSSRRVDTAVDHFVEIGPHPVLKTAIREVYDKVAPNTVPSYSSMLDRRVPAALTVMQVAGQLYCLGVPVLMAMVNRRDSSSSTQFLVDLPQYPFDHSKLYWQESPLSKEYRFRPQRPHELLGDRILHWNPLKPTWRNIFYLSDNPWVIDHKIQGTIVFPAAGIIALAMEGARQHLGAGKSIAAFRFKDTVINKATVIPADPGYVEWQLSLQPNESNPGESLLWTSFQFHVREDANWVKASHGVIGVELGERSQDFSSINGSNSHTEHVEQVITEGRNRCNISMTKEKFYEGVRKMGYDYGASFQGMKHVSLNRDVHEATAVVDLVHWRSNASKQSSSTYTIHPAALDTMFQLLSCACIISGPNANPPILPTQIKTMWISNDLDTKMESLEVDVHAVLDYQGFRAADCSLTVADSSSGKPTLTGSFQAAFMQDQEKKTFDEADYDRSKICYNAVWEPDTDFLTQSDFQPEFHKQTVDQSLISNNLDYDCFVSLVCRMIDYTTISQDMLENQPHFNKYVQWMKDAALQHKNSKIDQMSQKDFELFTSEIESYGITGKVLATVAKALPQVIKAEADPLELLFKDGLLDEYYAKAYDSGGLYAEQARYVHLLAHKNPQLKILEIGAGTGAASTPILKVLAEDESVEQYVSRFAEYNYTDISPSFFERAKDKYAKQVHNMRFTVFDVEKDPESQGIELGSYDVVIASNVIHATSSLQRSLKNVKKLLKPNGTFLLQEAVRPDSLGPTFIFGLLPGWWASTEPARARGPLLCEEAWDVQLREAGFSGASIQLKDHNHEHAHVFTTMLSKVASNYQPHPSSVEVGIVIQETQRQKDLAKLVQTRLQMTGVEEVKIVTLKQINSSNGVLTSDMHCIFLPDWEIHFLQNMNAHEFEALKHILTTAKSVIWPSNRESELDDSPIGSMTPGFLRSVRMENDAAKIISLSFERHAPAGTKVDYLVQCLQKACTESLNVIEIEYEQRGGVLGTVRLKEARPLNESMARQLLPQEPQSLPFGDGSRPLKLTIGNPGLLNTLHFIDDDIALTPVADDEIEIEVMCSGLNFKDLLTALGQVNQDHFGLEASGVVTQSGRESNFKPGDRVTCFTGGTFSSYARCKALNAVKLPTCVDFRSAAALPVIYGTAYYSLIYQARIRAGETVLIHSAAGGLGQALIQIAQLEGAEIYATVSSDSKRDFLISKYGLSHDHIFSSRSCEFLDRIISMTNGRGVDVVVNSLSGEKMQASWECIAPFGRFIEVGMKDIMTFQNLPLKQFANNATFVGVNLAYMGMNNPRLAGEVLTAVVDLFATGKITVPSDFRVYNVGQIEEAFRLMQSGKATGKAVFEHRPEDLAMMTPDTSPKYYFDPNATYLISGGLGGLGRSAAKWMTQRGARNLVLLSRKLPSSYNTKIREFLHDLEERGVNVACPTCDIGDPNQLKAALSTCAQTMPPIKGCIQGSMILRDELLRKMTLTDFRAVCNAKVQGTWNLHCELPKELDFFIVLSSAAGLLGNHGQSAYSAGNSFQDALVQYRLSRGQKAVSFDLGVMKDIGYVAEQLGKDYVNDILSSTKSISEAEFLAMLEIYCNPNLPLLTPSESQVISGIETGAAFQKRGKHAYWLDRPMFRYLHQMDAQSQQATVTTTDSVDYFTLLKQATSITEASDIICEALLHKLSRAIGVDVQDVEVTKPLHVYGVDSLSAVELRNWFARIVHADVAVFEILGNNTIAVLSKAVAEKSSLVSPEAKKVV